MVAQRHGDGCEFSCAVGVGELTRRYLRWPSEEESLLATMV
jgi:hypothetical protein